MNGIGALMYEVRKTHYHFPPCEGVGREVWCLNQEVGPHYTPDPQAA